MLFFLDIETTGLCHVEDYMLEIACVAFDGANVLDSRVRVIDPSKGSHVVGRDDSDWKERMGGYVTDMHTQNNLIDEIDEGVGVSITEAEASIVDFIKGFNIPKPIIAGNSIHFDRRFIREQMSALDAGLNHRMFDCSTLKMFAAAHWPDLVQARNAEVAHRALPDCMESLATYQHYVERFNPRRFAARARRA